jgi:hypothetical protein
MIKKKEKQKSFFPQKAVNFIFFGIEDLRNMTLNLCDDVCNGIARIIKDFFFRKFNNFLFMPSFIPSTLKNVLKNTIYHKMKKNFFYYNTQKP